MKTTLALAVLVSIASIACTSGASTCDPTSWSAGHDFKNRQYSHTTATSPGDWYVRIGK